MRDVASAWRNLATTLLALPLAACAGAGDVPIDSLGEEIVNGTAFTAPNTGIVRLVTASCSGTLVNNDWVLTANHCASHVGDQITMDGQTRTVQSVLPNPDGGVDIALLHLSAPMSVLGSTVSYRRALRHSLAPAGSTVRCFGYGKSVSVNAPGTDEALRYAVLTVGGGASNVYFFVPNAQGQSVALGDAGGPCLDGDGAAVAILRSNSGSGTASVPGETFAVSSDYYAHWVESVTTRFVDWGHDFTADQGWRTAAHPRMLATVNPGRFLDLVGFGDAGVYLSISGGDKFNTARLVLAEFGVDQGWSVSKHVRTMADVDGDGREDIVGFGDDGVWTALSTGEGFAAPRFVIADLGYNQGWRVETHTRILADINGDKRKDIVAFGNDGVWVALATGGGNFSAPQLAVANLGANQGWSSAKHLRTTADLNNDGREDIVAFGDAGVWTALSTGNGFTAPRLVVADFGYNQGWRVDRHPRQLVDQDRDGRKDIIGFGDNGVYTARSLGDGTFGPFTYASSELGYATSVPWGSSPRFAGDLNGDGYPELFGIRETHTAAGFSGDLQRQLGGANGFFSRALTTETTEGPADSLILVGDLDGNGMMDIVNFKQSSISVLLSK